jgi:type IV pilus assembly protein PilN
MIRINLLAVERERTKRRAIIPAAHRVAIGASLILIGTALVIGWWFWSLHQASRKLDDDIAKGEAETQQLRAVLGQVQRFEARKAQLQQRVTLIEQLRRGQAGPVHALDEISKAVPERLWLTDMNEKATLFTINGLTTSLTGLSDFVANLESSTWFNKPIDIIDSQVVPGDSKAGGGDMFKFTVKASFNNPDAPPLPAAPVKGGRGAKPAAAKPPAKK